MVRKHSFSVYYVAVLYIILQQELKDKEEKDKPTFLIMRWGGEIWVMWE